MLRTLAAAVACALLLTLAAAGVPGSPDMAVAAETDGAKPFKFTKDPRVSQIMPKKPVRIKLRRLSGGEYTWEISGDNAAEIIRADEELKKHYGVSK